MILIRPFEPEDRKAVLVCIAALQEFGRAQDARLPPGESMAEPYLNELLAECERYQGALLVAQRSDRGVVGFAAVLAWTPALQPWDGVAHEARLMDLYVQPGERQSGIGAQLMEHVEAFARARGARWLRTSVFAKNPAALGFYRRLGFEALEVTLERDLGA